MKHSHVKKVFKKNVERSEVNRTEPGEFGSIRGAKSHKHEECIVQRQPQKNVVGKNTYIIRLWCRKATQRTEKPPVKTKNLK